ncbi:MULTISPECIES: MFS transporter [unclassified Bacillus (in: firmicutes)]|uniref:MFS transporter n=1 Tax=unclassified Bacillus (in: firmicutes) TaxID=185979 RepID=UPI0020D27779|nr:MULTISPECIES: MFS transporter [unclassified Bacillus (in: firmicutes)]
MSAKSRLNKKGSTMTRKSFYLLSFIMLLSMTGYGVVLPALPYLADNLGLSSFQMGSLITGWALTQFLVVPFWGRLIDRIGRKPVLLIGLFGFGIAFLLMVFAESYGQLLVIRIIGAMLSSGTQPAALALVIDSNEKEKRSKALANMGAANALGFLCGPTVGGIFSPMGLHAPFIAAGILSLSTIPFVHFLLSEPEQKNQKLKEVSFKDTLKHMVKPGYRNLLLITFGLAVSTSSLFGVLGYFMIDRFQSSASETGLAFSAQSLSSVVIQMLFMGFILSKLHEVSITKIGLLIEIIGFACIAFSVTTWMVFAGCLLVGAGQAIARPTIISLISKLESVGQGTVMGFQQSMDSLGRSVGPLFAGWIFMFHPSAPFVFSSCICLVLFVFIVLNLKKESHSYIREKETGNEYLAKQ